MRVELPRRAASAATRSSAWARLDCDVDIASEFRYRGPVLDERTLVVGVSQSGETIDTLQALREARRGGARIVAVCNVVDASMAREADAVLYTRAGLEICVAATKTVLAQVVALELLALRLAQVRATRDARRRRRRRSRRSARSPSRSPRC